jgi:glycosyltransferase involved in cell wall biosynthesis
MRLADRVNVPPKLRILAMMEANSVTGPAKNLLGFCRWLQTAEGAQTGLSIAIATFTRDAGKDNQAFTKAVDAAGVDLHLIRERYRYDPGVIPQIREIANKFDPKIIQTHNNKSHLLIKLQTALRRPRLWMAFYHGYTYTDLKQRLINSVDRLSLRSADRVVTVCQAFEPRIAACGVARDRVRILHNSVAPFAPVPPSDISNVRTRLGVGPDTAFILTIGRFSLEKGHAILLHALQQMRSVQRKWKMVFVGAGPEQETLVRLADSLGLRDLVVFAGSHADVAPFYSAADLFVLPSLTEGSSNVLLEAMAAKLPIVATNAGGNAEIVLHDETGLLVPIRDRDQLANAIARLLTDTGLASRLAKAAVSRAGSEFSVGQYRRRLLGFYADALRAKNVGVDLPTEFTNAN